MVLPAGTYKCQVAANIRNSETMVHTLWLAPRVPGAGAGADATQFAADSVRDAFARFLTVVAAPASATVASLLDAQTIYTTVTAYQMDPATGRATDLAQAGFASTAKGTATAPLPPQVALVLSLKSGRPGRSRNGRLFLGGLGTNAMASDGRLTSAAQAVFGEAGARLFREMGSSPQFPDAYDSAIVSALIGEANSIKSVRVGGAFDTQRSRRKNLADVGFTYVVNP
jgi:hypothetical protein